ncbi:hypothetical protein ASJ33_05680 [Dehalococcoides mccartyi]|jgi:signal transduction histidine kinase|uniref:hypothetical protein n=1 Tax=Dehalococcoides mccartyi TaxID=61435 RepID=UPI0004E09474|nr:hypothetical protein [Dehalococcoides mccartyi]AII58749.1 hypothetical protein X792_05125 [Dehalococcoides mccartyi CG1]APH12679.1 hypothetical protein ASJ33_05680 [Dehalococcoides mccartyi]
MTKEEQKQINDLAVVVARIDERTINIEKTLVNMNKAIDKAQNRADEACYKANKAQTQLSTLKWVGGFIAALLGALGGWLGRG